MSEHLTAIEIEVGFRHPITTPVGSIRTRRSVLVRIETASAFGWSEAPAFPSGRSGTASEAWDDLVRPEAWVDGVPTVPIALAAVEAARADAAARTEGIPLYSWLGASGSPTLARHPIGMLEPDEVGREIAWLDTHEIAAVKIKVGPNRDVAVLERIRAALPELDIAVDANGGYADPDDAIWARMDALGVAFVEQPFPPHDLEAHAALATRAGFLVCLDETLDDPQRADRAIRTRAAGAISLKLNRHGLTRCRRLMAHAADHDIAVMIGGTFDTAVGRRHLLAAAGLPGVIDAAVGPPSAYLKGDIATYPPLRQGLVAPDEAPGIGVVPDPTALEHFAIRSASVQIDTDAGRGESVR